LGRVCEQYESAELGIEGGAEELGHRHGDQVCQAQAVAVGVVGVGRDFRLHLVDADQDEVTMRLKLVILNRRNRETVLTLREVELGVKGLRHVFPRKVKVA
jgi:hypothetical protein